MTFAYGERRMSALHSSLDLLCHTASLLEALAFLQHNVILLRGLEAVSAAMIAAYSFVHTRLLTDCHFIWACINFTINAQHLISYYFKLWALRFTTEEQALWVWASLIQTGRCACSPGRPSLACAERKIPVLQKDRVWRS